MQFFLLGLVVALFDFTAAATLRVQIPPSNLLPNPKHSSCVNSCNTHLWYITSTWRPTTERLDTRVSETSLLQEATSSTSSPVISPSHPTAWTSPLKDDRAVIDSVWGTYRGTRWEDNGPLLGGASADPTTSPPQPQIVTVSAKVLNKKDFYEERPGFNLMSFAKEPYHPACDRRTGYHFWHAEADGEHGSGDEGGVRGDAEEESGVRDNKGHARARSCQ